MLKDKKFLEEYRTGEHDIVKELYQKAFQESIEYWRAVGYFRSSSLEAFGITLQKFLHDGGKIKLITSVELTESDKEAIEEGSSKKEVCEKRIQTIIENEFKENVGTGVSKLAYLLEIGRLEIKIALPKKGSGIYHEKVGLFFDAEGNYIAFSGSANESSSAFHQNYECIEVFTSWEDHSRAEKKKHHFESLWNEINNDVEVFKFSVALQRALIKTVKEYSITSYGAELLENENENLLYNKRNVPQMPPWLNLRDYQKEAIRTWIKSGGRGIWAMATGTGKTITALTAIEKIANNKNVNKLTLLICVPSLYLMEQWINELESFNIFPVKCSSSNQKWENELNVEITSYYTSDKCFLPIITTVDTYITERFQRQIKKLNNIFLVVDEVHNFGTENIIKSYDDQIPFRLGLSATPQRHFDESGTESIFQYFGGIVFEYSLQKAIDSGHLTPYYYFPIFVNLTEEEFEYYMSISEKIAKASVYENDKKPSHAFTLLLVERARIINGAKNKLTSLVEIIKNKKLIDSHKNLIYCPDNIFNDERYIDKVYYALQKIGMNVKKFTADEDLEQRNNLVYQLKNDLINGLVAIRVLDEGVDIPSIERAFILASSTNPKEFIQRRGRILRKSPNKQFSELYDFIVIPDNSNNGNWDNDIHTKYLEKELKRYMEFARLAINRLECEKLIFDLQKEYDLLHII